MAQATSRLYVPALGGIYSALNEYAEPILRIGLGAILIPHGMQKLFGAFGGMGLTANAALFDRIGYTPGMFWGTLVGCTELIGGILLVVGLFTRFAAAAVLIFMIVAVKFTSAKGFLLDRRRLRVSAADRALCVVLRHPWRGCLVARPLRRARNLTTGNIQRGQCMPAHVEGGNDRGICRDAFGHVNSRALCSPIARLRPTLRASPT